MNELFMNVIAFLAVTAFPAVLFVIGASVPLKDLGQELRRPLPLLRLLAVTNILVPLVTAGVLKLLTVPPILQGLMLLSAATGGSVFAMMGVKSKKGNMALASASMVFLCLLAPLVIPFWLWVFDLWFGLELSAAPAILIVKLLPYSVPPLLLGVLCREWIPSVTKILQVGLNWFSKLSILLFVLLYIKAAVEFIFGFTLAAFAATFIVTTITIFAGYYLEGGTDRADKICGSMTASLSNVSAWLLIIHLSYPKVHVWNITTAYIVLRFVYIAIWYRYHKFLVARQAEQRG